MLVDVIRAAGPSALGEEVYYFCSRDCERRFNVAPEVYAAAGFAQQPAMCCSVATSRAGAASALRA
jgi:YHS domain-containing protein